MLSYKDFTILFGSHLFDKGLQSFLTESFSDLADYDLETDYITSKSTGIELGFTNNDGVYSDNGMLVLGKSNPTFSHFVIYPKSMREIENLPFNATFGDKRSEIIAKAGSPTQTKEGFADFLNKSFLVDNYKLNDIVITFDYDAEKETLNFVQVRDNNLARHLML